MDITDYPNTEACYNIFEIDENNPSNDKLTSLHSNELDKLPYHIVNEITCTLNQNGGVGITYEIPNASERHFLEKSALIINLPEIKIKKEHVNDIKICWKENTCISIIEKCNFIYKNKTIQSLDKNSIYYLLNKYFKGRKDELNITIGNKKQLINKSSCLPETECKFLQPWFYYNDIDSRHKLKSFPLFFGDNPTHIYKYDLLIKNHINMYKKVDNKSMLPNKDVWELIDIDFNYIVDIQGKDLIPTPSLVCYISQNHKNEIQSYLSTSYMISFTTLIHYKPDNFSNKEAPNATIELKSEGLSSAIIFSIQNNKRDNILDYIQFDSILQSIILRRGDNNIKTYSTSDIYFDNLIYTKGINPFNYITFNSIDLEPFNFIGIDAANGKFSITFNLTIDDDSKYTIHLFQQVTRQIKFIPSVNNEESNFEIIN